jgi:inhibitor of KinA sporulation pathway (predicted exonuclease)
MAKLLDKVLVVDVEATCWERNSPIPRGMKNEIIEIGICLLDLHTGEISKNRGIIVTPENSEVSDFCTQLTTITQEMVNVEGISLFEACEILKNEYKSDQRAWASFGQYDQKQFQTQCRDYKIQYPFSPSHLNVKTMFALDNLLNREIGMEGALKHLKIPLDGTHHRGVDDAKNIAKILSTILG